MAPEPAVQQGSTEPAAGGHGGHQGIHLVAEAAREDATEDAEDQNEGLEHQRLRLRGSAPLSKDASFTRIGSPALDIPVVEMDLERLARLKHQWRP